MIKLKLFSSNLNNVVKHYQVFCYLHTFKFKIMSVYRPTTMRECVLCGLVLVTLRLEIHTCPLHGVMLWRRLIMLSLGELDICSQRTSID